MWRGLNVQTRILLGTIVFALILGLIFLANWAGKPQYAVLYSGLEQREASNVVDWLQENNIDYRLEASGSTILVPQSEKFDLRLSIAGEGLTPQGGSVGFEIFDETRLGMTDQERRIQYIRAVSGEMERSIALIDGVQKAKVKISLPKESLFSEQEKPATSSVVLKLSPGFRLRESNVTAITQLLAGGIEGLNPENVTVVDTSGRIYTDSYGEDQFSQFSNKQLEFQHTIERKMTRKVESLLTRVFGPDNYAVTVTADINFDKKEIQDIIYTPVVGDEGIVRSEQTYEEEYEGGSGDQATGVPGAESNIPQYQETGSNNESNFAKEESTVNYEINERHIQQIVTDNGIEKLSVSVIVNRQEFSEEERQQFTDIISSAIGYNQERGDQITVTGMAFDNSLEDMMAETQNEGVLTQRQLFMYGLVGLLLLVGGFIIYRRRKQAEERAGIDITVGDEAQQEMAATRPELSPEEQARQELREEISELVSKRPEDVAQLLKSWLMED